MPSNHLILCRPLLHLPSIFPSIKVFSNESALHIRWPNYWSFSISPSNEHSGLIFRMDWLDLLAVQGTLKSILQHHSSKASILRRSAFFTVQLWHPYMTAGKYCCFCGGRALSMRAQVFLVLWGRWSLPSPLSLPASCVRKKFFGLAKKFGLFMTSYEKPERTFWPTQYYSTNLGRSLEDSAFKTCLGGGREILLEHRIFRSLCSFGVVSSDPAMKTERFISMDAH